MSASLQWLSETIRKSAVHLLGMNTGETFRETCTISEPKEILNVLFLQGRIRSESFKYK